MTSSSRDTNKLYTQKAQLGMSKSNAVTASCTSLSAPPKTASTQNRLPSLRRKQKERIVIIVCGSRFETYESTLNRFPNTLLGNKLRRDKYFHKASQCFLFNRNREAFHAILFYYQSFGILSCPSDVPLECFIEEAKFFGLDTKRLTVDDRERLPKRQAKHPARNWQEVCWFTLEYSNYSKLAKMVSIFWIISIIYGITIYCFETERSLHKTIDKHLPFDSDLQQSMHPSGFVSSLWTSLEIVAVLLFSIDFFLRFIFAPEKLDYIRSPYGTIDLLTLIPSYIWIVLCMINPSVSPDWFRRIICFLRSLRVLKFVRYSYGVQYVIWVLSRTMKDIPCFNLDMIVCVVFFATLLFNSEYRVDPGRGFDSIPEAVWYVIISMTSVGYGDVTCVTIQGKLTTTACILIGILVLVSLPTPFFYQEFGHIYTKWEEEEKEEETEANAQTLLS